MLFITCIKSFILPNYKEMISIKIKDPLFTYRARLVNILDFNPKKLSIEKVYNQIWNKIKELRSV